jgi:hypothetical protein
MMDVRLPGEPMIDFPRIPLGYELRGGRIVPREEWHEPLVLIFDAAKSRTPLPEIVRQVNNALPGRVTVDVGTVQNILRDPAYTGEAEGIGELVPVVSRADWQAASGVLDAAPVVHQG